MWIKKGVVYKPDGSLAHSLSHAQVPFAYKHKDFLRVYFSSRDAQGQSRPTFIDVDYNDPTKILYVHDKPVLELGGPGEYDETGAMPAWFVDMPNGDIWLYYTGWNRTHNSYRLSMGLSVSSDGGLTFKKMFKGPIMDRSIQNPIWAAQPSVMFDNGVWRMWYISGQKCEYIHGYPEPFYDCRYAESKDGLVWERHDDRAGIERSADGWDSMMMDYCHIFPHQNERIMFYNGNGFGASGFGYATEGMMNDE